MYAVLDPERPAIGVAEVCGAWPGQRVAPGQPVHDELALEVPQRQAVSGGIGLGMQAVSVGEGVEVRDQMPAHLFLHEALDVNLLHRLLVLAVQGVHVGLPAHGLIAGRAVAAEDLFINPCPPVSLSAT